MRWFLKQWNYPVSITLTINLSSKLSSSASITCPVQARNLRPPKTLPDYPYSPQSVLKTSDSSPHKYLSGLFILSIPTTALSREAGHRLLINLFPSLGPKSKSIPAVLEETNLTLSIWHDSAIPQDFQDKAQMPALAPVGLPFVLPPSPH